MKVLVTGATGFVGSHVARVLAETGAELRLLVRLDARTDNIESLRAERVTGDLLQPETIFKAVQGCEAVFHVAADYRLWTPGPTEVARMYRCNVEGTRVILKAARESGVRRVVYTSSVATMGFTANGRPADEDSPVSLGEMIGHYKRSKFMAEQLAIEAGKSGQDVVIVNPTTPIGEMDIKPTPTFKFLFTDFSANSSMVARSEDKFFASSEGSRIQQYILHSYGQVSAQAPHPTHELAASVVFESGRISVASPRFVRRSASTASAGQSGLSH